MNAHLDILNVAGGSCLGIKIIDKVYKTVDGYHMICRIYKPDVKEMARSKGALLFYFGGGWTGGTIDQFIGQSEYLASKGLTCIVVDYRVKSRHNVTPFECIEDCRDSIKWLLTQGDALGINVDNLILVGASAGGHVATATFLMNQRWMSKHIKGLVLYNPVLDTSETGFAHERFGGRGIEVSPVHLLKAELPKMLIFHGTKDHTVPFEHSQRFARKSIELGNLCELVAYEGADHGFFNYTNTPDHYATSLLAIEAYLREINFL